MKMEDMIVTLFVKVDDAMKAVKGHAQEELAPSELATLAILFVVKGIGKRPFYRWLEDNWRHFFPRLPERTRFFRRLFNQRRWAAAFLAGPTMLGCIDSYGVEFIHPNRERQKRPRIAKKGLSNKRWIVGGKACVELNNLGQVIDFDTAPANTHDSAFLELPKRIDTTTIVLGDGHFHDKDGLSKNVKVCKRGHWNDRMVIETVFSMMTRAWGVKKRDTRSWGAFEVFWAYAAAAFNILTAWHGLKPDERGFVPLSIKEFVL
jgi:hypothetical protein